MKRDWLERLGKPGVAGLGLLLFCLSFYLGHIAPAQQELSRLQGEAAQLGPAPPTGAPPAEGAAPRQVPAFATATDALKNLNALAEQHGLKPERGTYQLSDKDGLQRLEVIQPLRGGYLPLRAYLHDVLTQPATPAIDELVLQRQKASDTTIEANLRLSFYFTGTP